MKCSNPNCQKKASDIREGTLRLVELEVDLNDRITGNESGFPVCAVPSRYFWLCAECSRFLSIRRWTRSGLILEYKHPAATYRPQIHSIRKPTVVERPEGPEREDVLVRSA